MASPQTENGHIDIANTIADKFCSYRLSGQEWQVVWVVLRKTWGWLINPDDKNGPKKKMDRIALSQFSQLSGIDRRKCHSILKKLIEKKVINKSVTQKGDRSVITYGFQKNFDLWKVSPKKALSPKKATKVSPKKAHTKDILKKVPSGRADHDATPPKTINGFDPAIIEFVSGFTKYSKEKFQNNAPDITDTLIHSSADTIDKLIRLDGFKIEYVKKVIRWAAKDDFWKQQVRSLSGLRKSKDGLKKFQNIAVSHDEDQPDKPKTKIYGGMNV